MAFMLCAAVTAQDSVQFKSGTTASGKVTSYANGMVTVRLDSGELKSAPIQNISSIEFSDSFITQSIESNGDDRIQSDLPAIPLEQPTAPDEKDIVITVRNSRDNIKPDGDVAKMWRKEMKRGVAVDILIENRTKDDIKFLWWDFELRDQNLAVHDSACVVTMGMPGEIAGALIKAGDKQAGWVGFEVSIGTQLESSEIRYCSQPKLLDNKSKEKSRTTAWVALKD